MDTRCNGVILRYKDEEIQPQASHMQPMHVSPVERVFGSCERHNPTKQLVVGVGTSLLAVWTLKLNRVLAKVLGKRRSYSEQDLHLKASTTYIGALLSEPQNDTVAYRILLHERGFHYVFSGRKRPGEIPSDPRSSLHLAQKYLRTISSFVICIHNRL